MYLRCTQKTQTIVIKFISINLSMTLVFKFPDSRVKVKAKFTLEQAMKAQSGSRGTTYSFFNLGARWGGWSTPRPVRFTAGKDPVPIVYQAEWAPGPAGRVRKISPPPEFDPRTV